MYFKVLLTVNDISTKKDSIVQFEVNTPYLVQIELKNPPKDYLDKSTIKSLAFCEVHTSLEPDGDLLEIFNKMNLENKPISTDPSDLEKALSKPIYLHLKQELVPENYADYLNQIESDLRSTARQLIGLLRWTNNYLGPHDPLVYRGAYWSFDNVHWYHFPISFKIFQTRQGYTLHLRKHDLERITELLDKGIHEPIYHELFSEAWSQRVENPRSAIAVGVAAVEVGVKILISKIIPETKWLVEHLIMPPIYDILIKYLPNIQSLSKSKSKCVIPKSLTKTVKEFVEIRNKLVHVGTTVPNKKEIEQMLEDVKDILLLFDYYGGYEFSLSFIRKETIQKLGDLTIIQ